MVGRPPKPAHLKVAAIRSRPQTELAQSASIPEKPEHLTGRASQEWDRLAPMLFAAGVLTDLDGPMLATLCNAIATQESAQKLLDESGIVIKGPSGAPMVNPLVAVCKTQGDMVAMLSREFGMSSAARTKVSISPKPKIDGIESALCG